MPTVTLSEAGIALILLEQELRNNELEVARRLRAVDRARDEYKAACEQRSTTLMRIETIKDALR